MTAFTTTSADMNIDQGDSSFISGAVVDLAEVASAAGTADAAIDGDATGAGDDDATGAEAGFAAGCAAAGGDACGAICCCAATGCANHRAANVTAAARLARRKIDFILRPRCE
jgi:hypothetical protein